MDSIKNASISQQALLNEQISQLVNLIQLTKSRYEQNIQNQKLSYQNYTTTNQNLIHQFFQLKQLISKQQEIICNKIKQQFIQSKLKFQQKNCKYKHNLEFLSHCLGQLQRQLELSNLEFLAHINQRSLIISQINNNVQQTQKILNVTQHKNITAQNIIKCIQKNFKITNNSNQLSTIGKPPHTNSKPSKKSTNQISQNSKILQQNQNQKPMSKKHLKKQAIPTTYTTNSVLSSMIINKTNNPPQIKSTINVTQNQKRNATVNKQKIFEKDKFYLAQNCDVSAVQQKQSLFNSFFSSLTTSFLNDQKFIYVIGGFNQESSSIIRLNLATYKWEEVSFLKAPRSKFGCVAIQKNIYILGGKKGRERVADVEIWNSGNWKTGVPLKKKRSGFGVISYEHLIYIIGGNDGQNILNSVEVLDTQTGEWSRKEPMSEMRDELAVCIGKDNKIYAIGGFGGKNNESLKSVQIFDIRQQKWSKGPPMKIARRALAAAALADGIYAIGGFDGTKHLSCVEKYEEGGSQWVRLVELKRGRCTHSAVSIFQTQQIIVMGGFDEEVLDSVQKYSLITNEWEEIAKMPSPRFMHASVLFTQ